MNSEKAAGFFIVDDEEYLINCYREVLGYLGLEARFFTSSEEALSAAKTEKPAVVLTDYSMPKLNGVELARELTGSDPAVHVIIATGHMGEQYEELEEQIGEMDNVEMVAKPLKIREVLARVEEILQGGGSSQ